MKRTPLIRWGESDAQRERREKWESIMETFSIYATITRHNRITIRALNVTGGVEFTTEDQGIRLHLRDKITIREEAA